VPSIQLQMCIVTTIPFSSQMFLYILIGVLQKYTPDIRHWKAEFFRCVYCAPTAYSWC